MEKSSKPDTMTARVPALLFCRQHALHHVLVRAMRSHGDEGCSRKAALRVFPGPARGRLVGEVQAFSRFPGEGVPIVSTIHGGGDGLHPPGIWEEQYPGAESMETPRTTAWEDVRPDDGSILRSR